METMYTPPTVGGLKVVTDTVANATKMVQLATRSFQAVAKLCRMYQIVTKTCELVTKFLVLSRQKWLPSQWNPITGATIGTQKSGFS